jgi:hypothetical protein
MMEGLLLDRVDDEAARATICRQNDSFVAPRPHEAEAPLALAQAAGAGADVTLNAAVVELVPVRGWNAFEQDEFSVADDPSSA